MSLPPPGQNVFWKDYEIDTPTFQLTPIEKPDMSPFLIHMTGPNQLFDILEGQGSAAQIPQGYGYLQANTPAQARNGYDAKVVCFTDSPTFALDFFRYRSYPRWKKDMRYGIGFDKSALISIGARPVAYFADEITKEIISLHKAMNRDNSAILDDTSVSSRIHSLFDKIYPLLFPMLENQSRQGFMWEREWRIADPTGFTFPYTSIKVICCPHTEETKLRSLLGNSASRITFVRTWKEYDDITDYLQRQQSIWRMSKLNSHQQTSHKVKIQQIKTQVQQYNVAINSLASYRDFTEHLIKELEKLNHESEQLVLKRAELQRELEQLEKDAEPIFDVGNSNDNDLV